MPRRTIGGKRGGQKTLVTIVTVSLLTSLLSAVVTPTAAFGAGTILFQNAFNNRTVDGTGTVTVPIPASGTNAVCLTASGNTTTPPVLSCTSSTDSQGSGKLRLTSAAGDQVGGVAGQGSFPTSAGLDVTFNSYQYGGNGADGLAFVLAAVDPTNPVAPTAIGPGGGSLGYSTNLGINGLMNGYLGVGFDVYGNFSANAFSGSGCTNPTNITTAVPGAVVVRGPGSGTAGYCGLTTTYTGSSSSKVNIRASSRNASAVPVEVLVNPTTVSFTATSGVAVAAGTYKVVFTDVSTGIFDPASKHTLTGTLPTVAAAMYPSANWLNSSNLPKQLAFGFVGSTGGSTDAHEISDVKVSTFTPVPQLALATTSYSAATSQPGDPVTYSAVASVLSGANEAGAISVAQTVPVGVVPVGAYGTGWVCQAAVGRTITCTTSASSFTNGTTLPAVTVVAIVTAAGVTSTTIQASSPATASSTDANPATDSVTTLGTVPTGPSGISLAPSIGSIAGGNTVTVSGANIIAATAIEIGTTSEQQAGTPVTLLPCPGAAAAGCFTVSGSTLVISSMPARAGIATATVTVVTSGVAAAANYVFADKPATPAAPSATAGSSSATVTWVAPANNGSVITGYIVTPYRNGVAQATQAFDVTTTTRALTGLTVGASYTFTVAAVNAFGTGTASAASNAVVPYTVPGAPTITAATAGTAAATLTWTAPSTGGSPITGYVVTPYIGATAQAPQTFAGTGTTQTLTGLTPGAAYTFTVAAQNVAGTGPASAKSASVTPNVSPSLSFTAPPAGEVGVPYSRALTVTDGTAPFAWSISAGSLPAGLTLNASTGLLSGTPTAAGSFTFTVRVVDASGQSATKSVTLVVAAAPTLAFTPGAGEVGVAYSQQPTLSGGTSPVAWTVSAGSLPAGLTLDPSTGLVSGTPTAAGNFSLTILATDAFSQVASKTVSLAIVARPAFAATAPPAGQLGVAYSTTFDVTGGTAPLVWSISAGSLPSGLTLNTSTGVLSGTPTTVGSSSFTVSVTDANSQTATKAVTLVIAAGPLVIVKTANVSSAAAGSTVAYTITVTNTGSTAWAGVALSDPLTGVLDDAVYNANATASAGTLTYTAPTLGWTGNIAASGSVTISYSVTVNNPDVGNKVLANTVTSSTLGTNCASGGTDARCTATVTVPGLTIVKTADVSTTTPGSTVHFTIVVTNTGQTAYSAATLTDGLAGVLDDATYNADAVATSGNLSFTTPALTWTGSLAVGASATITYMVTVANPDNGNRSLAGTVVSPSAGSPCPSGNPAAQCTATVTVLVPALSITNTADVATASPGDIVHYTLRLANTGQTIYTAISVALDLSGALDDATYNSNVAASAGSVVYNTGTGTLVWTGNLAIGAVITITASVTVRAVGAGNLELTTVASTAAAGSTCPAGSPNSACTTSVQVRVPELTITKSADVSTTTPGSVVHYTVSVTNTGQTAYSGATFSDALAGVLDDAIYNNDGATTAGTVSFSSPTLTWIGNLAIAASATITYSVTVSTPDNGNRTLTGTVTSTTPGSTCPAAGSDPSCTSSVTVLIPGLRITTSLDTPTTTPGAVVRYAISVVNTGQTTYSDLALTLNLVGALDDAAYNFDAAISAGDLVTKPDGTVNWVLNLAPGASASGAMSMTVKDPATGNKSLRIITISNAVGSPCPTGAPTANCVATTTVLVPGLTITKTADKSTVTPGGTVSYTITVVNNGETTYPTASFTDSLRTVLTDATYANDATATTGTISYNAPD
ncbi:MAG: hypothetical protein JWP07_2694, partial [Pseudonocardiales bacterium]|nr:hypothetical protein [Pseudonocardiales bacterium]